MSFLHVYQRKFCKAVALVPSELELSTQKPADLYLKTNKHKLSLPYTCSIINWTDMLPAYRHVSVKNLFLFHIVSIHPKSEIFLFPSHPFVLFLGFYNDFASIIHRRHPPIFLWKIFFKLRDLRAYSRHNSRLTKPECLKWYFSWHIQLPFKLIVLWELYI